MTPTDTQTREARDIVERAKRLPPALRESIAHELLDEIDGEPAPPDPDHVRLAWKEEIARRIAAYQRGEVNVMSAADVIALLEADQREDERHAG